MEQVLTCQVPMGSQVGICAYMHGHACVYMCVPSIEEPKGVCGEADPL